MNNKYQTREEFEESAALDINKVIIKAKEIRNKLRQLEAEVTTKEEEIRNMQATLSELNMELVKIQAKMYAGGTI